MGSTLNYPRGSIIIFTRGEYSDYGVVGFLVAVKDCDLPTLAQDFTSSYQPEDEWDKPRLDGFASWLVASGHAMPVDANEVHLGSYNEWEPEFGVSLP